jgi:hypothetical protein
VLSELILAGLMLLHVAGHPGALVRILLIYRIGFSVPSQAAHYYYL